MFKKSLVNLHSFPVFKKIDVSSGVQIPRSKIAVVVSRLLVVGNYVD